MLTASLGRFERQLDEALLIAAVAVIPVVLIEQSHASETVKSATSVANGGRRSTLEPVLLRPVL